MVPKVSCSHLEQFVCGLPNVGQSTLKCIIFCFQLLLPSSSWSIIINHEQRLPPIGTMPPQSPLASDCGYLRHGSPWYLYRKHSKFLRRPHWTNKTGFCINFAFRPSHQQIVFIKIVQAQQVGITSYLIFFSLPPFIHFPCQSFKDVYLSTSRLIHLLIRLVCYLPPLSVPKFQWIKKRTTPPNEATGGAACW